MARRSSELSMASPFDANEMASATGPPNIRETASGPAASSSSLRANQYYGLPTKSGRHSDKSRAPSARMGSELPRYRTRNIRLRACRRYQTHRVLQLLQFPDAVESAISNERR